MNSELDQDLSASMRIALSLLPHALLLFVSDGLYRLNEVLDTWTQSPLPNTPEPITIQGLIQSLGLKNSTQSDLEHFLSQRSSRNPTTALTTPLSNGQSLKWRWLAGSNILLIENVTDWVEQINEFKNLSDTDPLTGLANRRRFQSEFTRLVAQSDRQQQIGGLVLLDIDDLKLINDQWGHAVGDQLLADFGRLAKPFIRPYECLARVGGDEFAIVTQHDGRDGTNRLIAAMKSVFEKINLPNGEPLHASFGTALFSGGESTVAAQQRSLESRLNQIYSDADAELYKDKKSKKGLISSAS